MNNKTVKQKRDKSTERRTSTNENLMRRSQIGKMLKKRTITSVRNAPPHFTAINQSIHFIADKLHPYKSSKKPLSRTGVHTINFSNAATRET